MRLLHEIAIFQTVKSEVIISLFETMRLSVSISLRNLDNSLRGGGGKGGQLFAGCKLIEAPAPNQCQIMTFFTLKTNYIKKIKNRTEKYTFRNTFK